MCSYRQLDNMHCAAIQVPRGDNVVYLEFLCRLFRNPTTLVDVFQSDGDPGLLHNRHTIGSLHCLFPGRIWGKNARV